jgi:hypothetical protein
LPLGNYQALVDGYLRGVAKIPTSGKGGQKWGTLKFCAEVPGVGTQLPLGNYQALVDGYLAGVAKIPTSGKGGQKWGTLKFS